MIVPSTTEHHVELAVAIDVGELRDVLAVGVDRDALHILQRVGRDDEARGGARPHVAVVADVAERGFRKKVGEPIAVYIHEAVPLADVDVLEAVCRQPPAICTALKEIELARVLLDEEIQDAVAIDVDQLGTGVLKAA